MHVCKDHQCVAVKLNEIYVQTAYNPFSSSQISLIVCWKRRGSPACCSRGIVRFKRSSLHSKRYYFVYDLRPVRRPIELQYSEARWRDAGSLHQPSHALVIRATYNCFKIICWFYATWHSNNRLQRSVSRDNVVEFYSKLCSRHSEKIYIAEVCIYVASSYIMIGSIL
jgi:hypothetical protein